MFFFNGVFDPNLKRRIVEYYRLIFAVRKMGQLEPLWCFVSPRMSEFDDLPKLIPIPPKHIRKIIIFMRANADRVEMMEKYYDYFEMLYDIKHSRAHCAKYMEVQRAFIKKVHKLQKKLNDHLATLGYDEDETAIYCGLALDVDD